VEKEKKHPSQVLDGDAGIRKTSEDQAVRDGADQGGCKTLNDPPGKNLLKAATPAGFFPRFAPPRAGAFYLTSSG